MGCTQTKAAAPATARPRHAALSEPPKATLLASQQNKIIKTPASAVSFANNEAIRVFCLADKDKNGCLDMTELAHLRNSTEMAQAMMAVADADFSGSVSQNEWLGYFAKLYAKDEKAAIALLKLYESQLNKAYAPGTSPLWCREAIRVFRMADKDSNGFLDMRELAYVRSSTEMAEATFSLEDAEAMMEAIDTDLSNTVSEDEWLTYFTKLFHKNEKSAALVLKLYEKNLTKSDALTTTPLWCAEAMRVFRQADKDNSGFLDLSELCRVRNSAKMADAMMVSIDTDLSGVVSQDEWLAYFSKLYSKNERSAAAVLKLYQRQLDRCDSVEHVTLASDKKLLTRSDCERGESVAHETALVEREPVVEETVVDHSACIFGFFCR